LIEFPLGSCLDFILLYAVLTKQVLYDLSIDPILSLHH